MKILFDSGVYIRAWHDERFQERLEMLARELKPRTYLSSVVVGECWAGARDAYGQKLVRTVFEPFERTGRIVSPHSSDWKEGGRLLAKMLAEHRDLRERLAGVWNDLLIALSAARIGATVFTFNRNDFDFIHIYKSFSLMLL